MGITSKAEKLINISNEQLRELLNQAFEAGYSSSPDLKESEIDRIISTIENTFPVDESNAKINYDQKQYKVSYYYPDGKCYPMQQSAYYPESYLDKYVVNVTYSC